MGNSKIVFAYPPKESVCIGRDIPLANKLCWRLPTILSMTDEDGIEHEWSLIDLLDGLTILAEKAKKNPPKKGGKYEP